MEGEKRATEGKEKAREEEECAKKREKGEREEEREKRKKGEEGERTIEGGRFETVRTNKHPLPVTTSSEKQKRDTCQKSGHRLLSEAPSILIEPDTRLELTEEMIQGENREVVTNDTLLAKASGSNLHEMEVRAVSLCLV